MGASRTSERTIPELAWRLLLVLALLKVGLHLATHHRYGYFRDELYYLACGRHLSWGYVDHPPLIAAVARAVQVTLGESLLALRLLPALAMAVVLLLSGEMARRLGGGRFAQGLAGVAALLSPAFLAMGTFLSMNPFDILWWTLGAYVLVRLLSGDDPRWWLVFGAVMGVGVLTKYNILLFGFAVAAAMSVTAARRQLGTKWPWLAAGLTVLIAAPNLVWQIRHGYPTLEFLGNIAAYKNYPVNPVEFVAMQFAVVHPLLFPVWVAGVAYFLAGRDGARYRMLGWTYLVVFMMSMLLKAKFYYLFPIYPLLFAAGGVALEKFATRRGRWFKPAAIGGIVAGGAFTAPYALPILPIKTFLRFDQSLGIDRELRFERGRERGVPIVFADMFGWPELAGRVVEEYRRIAADPAARCTILASNYGEAAAVDFFGRSAGLPPAVSPHNAYYDWGPGRQPWETVLAVGYEAATLREFFEEVSPLDPVRNGYARERVIPLHRCRGLKRPVTETWAALKRFQ